MDNKERAASLLNIYTSKPVKKYIVCQNINLFIEYVVELSKEDVKGDRVYVEFDGTLSISYFTSIFIDHLFSRRKMPKERLSPCFGLQRSLDIRALRAQFLKI